jgi:RNA polymerase sigma-70 factor (ECF subfamily)
MGDLYDLYARIVYRVILRTVSNQTLAEDLTQEAFLRVWNGVRGFDEKRGTLTSWINAVARNTAIDYLRSPAARNERTTVGLKDVEGSRRCSVAEDWLANLDRTRRLQTAFQKLTARQRLVIDMSYLEGMSHAEIARRLRRPLGTVKTWMRTALRAVATGVTLAAD